MHLCQHDTVNISSIQLKLIETIVTDKPKTAGHLFRTSGRQQVVAAFRCAVATLDVHEKKCVVEGRKLVLETGQLKLLPAIFTFLVTNLCCGSGANTFIALPCLTL